MRKARFKTSNISIGSVSEATLRTQDLIPAFLDILEHVQLNKAQRAAVRDVRARYDAAEDAEYFTGEDASFDCDELQDILSAIAPPYTYFGTSDGDGASFGFWPSWDTLGEDVRAGDVLKVSDTNDVPADYRGEVMHVSDRGNVTLYVKSARGLREVWRV